MIKTDVLIIGSGIAGLSFAASVAKRFPEMETTIVTKKGFLESNTNFAQGGIAIALDSTKDSYEKHIEDTIRAGDGLSDPEVVEKVIKEGPSRLEELLRWGIDFDRDKTGAVELAREGGHSVNRVIHHKDATGNHIASGLLNHLSSLKNVKLLNDHFAIDLITQTIDNVTSCYGAEVIDLNSNTIKTFSSRITLLATGGLGQIYETTTNPLIATGDGIAMANRAGAKIRDMEFIQFHPTAFYSLSENPSFLISEAVRGHGGYLRSKSGERFVFNYDVRGELASRDIVAKAIYHEMIKNDDESVFLDCRHLPVQELKKHFPNIYLHCLKKGFDLSLHVIPVAPAAHYICGGIEVDLHGKTALKNLYACGECSRTGLHGANRLASNSLLEALVYAHEIFIHVEKLLPEIEISSFTTRKAVHLAMHPCEKWIAIKRKEVRRLMSVHAGIVRSTESLLSAKEKLEDISVQVEKWYSISAPSVSICELRNMINVADLVLGQSLQRKENRGTYFNIDLK